MESPGFEIKVDGFCKHCEDFMPSCETLEITTMGDKGRNFQRIISCEHIRRCTEIKDFVRRNMENEQMC